MHARWSRHWMWRVYNSTAVWYAVLVNACRSIVTSLLPNALRFLLGFPYVAILPFLAECGLLLFNNLCNLHVEACRILLVSFAP